MEQTSVVKPVFLKYRWPPLKNDKKYSNNLPEFIKRTSYKEEIVENDIYQKDENNSIKPSVTYSDSAEISNSLYISASNENQDPRNSFIIHDPIETYTTTVNDILNKNGASTILRYLFRIDTERLTGPEAVRIAISHFMELKVTNNYDVDFHVNQYGITLTDVAKRIFFRKHYSKDRISYCGLVREHKGVDITPKGIFAFVNRKISGKSNECHLFRQTDINEKVINIVNFINVGYGLDSYE